MFRFVLPEHCTPRQPRDADGDRIFSHPYWSTWAEEEYASVKAFDREGIMLAVTTAYDKTDLSKEQGAFPIYLVSNSVVNTDNIWTRYPMADRCQGWGGGRNHTQVIGRNRHSLHFVAAAGMPQGPL